MDIYQFLNQNQISYQKHDHPAVYTCEEADRLVPDLPAAKTKNIFLRNKKGTEHYLLVVKGNKRVDLKELEKHIDSTRLSMASADRLNKYLGISPGAVSILSLLNDKDKHVSLFIDEDLRREKAWQCHPLINTSTLVIETSAIMRFLELTGHKANIINLLQANNV